MKPQNDRRLLVFVDAETGRRPARRCAADGCQKWTRKGKPYCPAHVFMHPYAAKVHAEARAMGLLAQEDDE